MSDLTYPACVVTEDRSAYCYGLSLDGYPVGFWSADPTAGNGSCLRTGRSPRRIGYGHPTTSLLSTTSGRGPHQFSKACTSILATSTCRPRRSGTTSLRGTRRRTTPVTAGCAFRGSPRRSDATYQPSLRYWRRSWTADVVDERPRLTEAAALTRSSRQPTRVLATRWKGVVAGKNSAEFLVFHPVGVAAHLDIGGGHSLHDRVSHARSNLLDEHRVAAKCKVRSDVARGLQDSRVLAP